MWIVSPATFSTDHLIPPGARIGGGVQLQHGVFTQADATVGFAKFFAGVRHSFTGQDSTFLSPSGGFVVGKKKLRGARQYLPQLPRAYTQ